MKYYVYSYKWKNRGETNWHASFALHAGELIDIYDDAATQPEEWLICSISEITEEEYDLLKKRDNIG